MQDDIVESDGFETNDTALAAYLQFCGHDVIGTEWEAGMCTFIFAKTEGLAKDFGKYITSSARVNPVQFVPCYISIMGMVKTARNNEKARLGVPTHERLEDKTRA